MGGLSADRTLERAYREHAVRLLALLVRELRDFDLAEEALQEASLAALGQWVDGAVPANPAGWLLTVARRRARDRLRREATLARKLPLLIVDARDEGDEPATTDIPDERLALLCTVCHPALAPEARVALTLRLAGGLTTREIARLFLVSEPTMAARITRAKRKIAHAGIPYRVPGADELPARTASLLTVVYLIFTEGYAPTSGDRVVRPELCAEAIRLCGLLGELLPDASEVVALLALMTLQHARRDARDADGRVVLLADQDRRRLRQDEIAAGLEHAREAARLRGEQPAGAYLLQALIAAEHARSRDAVETDWHAIAALYERLGRIHPSPIVEINRAIAIAEAHGPTAGLRLLDALDPGSLAHGHQLALARAELLLRDGRAAAAVGEYDRAVELTRNDAVRAHLTERRALASDQLPASSARRPSR